MAAIQPKQRISKKLFEKTLMTKHSAPCNIIDNITPVDPWVEFDPDDQPPFVMRISKRKLPNGDNMYMYFVDNNKHCATWTKGKGWEFPITG
tara:strand:- start:128 stop:403 length:276 start_codon:yes stop_codon:yes gene_type:complete